MPPLVTRIAKWIVIAFAAYLVLTVILFYVGRWITPTTEHTSERPSVERAEGR